MEIHTKREYFLTELLPLFRLLKQDQTPKWGSMSPQHMVEHVVGSWRVSNGRAKLEVAIPPEEAARRKANLMTDIPYERNLKNPLFKQGLPPLRKASLSEAIDQLEDEIIEFFKYHASEMKTEKHPVYGPLNTSEWLHFQSKHMTHHLGQFTDLSE